MKILIIGGTGTVGSHLIELLKKTYSDVYYTYDNHKLEFNNDLHLDITKRDDVINIIKKISPEIVIHSAALTNLDLCETNHKLATAINVNGTKNILDACEKSNCKIIFISTSFVFNGTKNPYSEDDPHDPATFYGKTKALAETLVMESNLKNLILRTDALYGWTNNWQRENSVVRTIKSLSSKKILREVIDWYNTPTYVHDFVNATKKLMIPYEGIYHLSGQDFVNRYAWSLKVAEIFDLDSSLIHPIHSSELNLDAKRANVCLSNNKINQKLNFKMKGIEEGLIDMFNVKN